MPFTLPHPALPNQTTHRLFGYIIDKIKRLLKSISSLYPNLTVPHLTTPNPKFTCSKLYEDVKGLLEIGFPTLPDLTSPYHTKPGQTVNHHPSCLILRLEKNDSFAMASEFSFFSTSDNFVISIFRRRSLVLR